MRMLTRRCLPILSVLLIAQSSLAAHLSAIRQPRQSYIEDAIALLPAVPAEEVTPWNSKKPLAQLDQSRVPAVADSVQLQQMFTKIRDLRGWFWSSRAGFARRIPWLYVDDGCYLRAEMVVEKFREWGFVVPKQVMAFGDLHGESPYGSATWWYHVAPIVRVGFQSYVLDPSLDARRPLRIEEWTSRMAPEADTTLAICNADVVDPGQDCASTETHWDAGYEEDQLQMYLGLEWEKLQTALGAEPAGLLGDYPPWSRSGF